MVSEGEIVNHLVLDELGKSVRLVFHTERSGVSWCLIKKTGRGKKYGMFCSIK